MKIMEPRAVQLSDGLRHGGAPRLWRRIVLDSLPVVRSLVPPGSEVLEIGFGDGILTCWLAQELEWRILALEADPRASQAARWTASTFRLRRIPDFRTFQSDRDEIAGRLFK